MRPIALVVGHKKNSPGACNKSSGECEYSYNHGLATDIKAYLEESGIPATLVLRNMYRHLPAKVNKLNPSVVISLHCNAFNRKASGCETLYYHTSKKGKELATLLQKTVHSILENPDRGIKPKCSEDRGGYLLRHTNAPAVILEPFFIDNNEDFARGSKAKDALARGIADAISVYTACGPLQCR